MRRRNQIFEKRSQEEFKASAGLGMLRAMAAVQVQIIYETIDRPIGKKWTSGSGQHCPALGPIQVCYSVYSSTILLINQV